MQTGKGHLVGNCERFQKINQVKTGDCKQEEQVNRFKSVIRQNERGIYKKNNI
jgi:hypothetical protein